MDVKELLIILVGAVAFIWILMALNSFVGGSGLFVFVGTSTVLGIGTICLGLLFYFYTQPYYSK